MKPINIKTKTIEIMPARTAKISDLTWRTIDDGFAGTLTVVVNNAAAIHVAGADYDALGEWTDDTIRDLIMAKFGFEVI
jgi:hypothetical protein